MTVISIVCILKYTVNAFKVNILWIKIIYHTFYNTFNNRTEITIDLVTKRIEFKESIEILELNEVKEGLNEIWDIITKQDILIDEQILQIKSYYNFLESFDY